MPFKPRLWPTLFTIPALATMLALGFWQLERLAWKTELIENFEARVAMEPADPPKSVENFDDWQYRRVTLSGRFLHDKEVHITGKSYKGSAGFHIITPFELDNGDRVLVNRGWVPSDRREQKERTFTLIEPPVTLVGLVRKPGVKGHFVPENEPHNNIWFTVQTEQMAEFVKAGTVANYYIDALRDRAKNPGLPYGASDVITVRNEHLQYALTWVLLALTLAVIYVLWHLKMERDEAAE